MKSIKSLDQLFKLADPHQVTAQEVLNGRTSLKVGSYQEVNFAPELREEVIQKIVETLGGRERTKVSIYSRLRNERPQHWGLARFLLVKYGDKPAYFSYCAGQDMPFEMKQIREALKK